MEVDQDVSMMDWEPTVTTSLSPAAKVKRSFDELDDSLPRERPIKRIKTAIATAGRATVTASRATICHTARIAIDVARHGPLASYKFATGIPFAARVVRKNYPRVPSITYNYVFYPEKEPTKKHSIESQSRLNIPGGYPLPPLLEPSTLSESSTPSDPSASSELSSASTPIKLSTSFRPSKSPKSSSPSSSKRRQTDHESERSPKSRKSHHQHNPTLSTTHENDAKRENATSASTAAHDLAAQAQQEGDSSQELAAFTPSSAATNDTSDDEYDEDNGDDKNDPIVDTRCAPYLATNATMKYIIDFAKLHPLRGAKMMREYMEKLSNPVTRDREPPKPAEPPMPTHIDYALLPEVRKKYLGQWSRNIKPLPSFFWDEKNKVGHYQFPDGRTGQLDGGILRDVMAGRIPIKWFVDLLEAKVEEQHQDVAFMARSPRNRHRDYVAQRKREEEILRGPAKPAGPKRPVFLSLRDRCAQFVPSQEYLDREAELKQQREDEKSRQKAEKEAAVARYERVLKEMRRAAEEHERELEEITSGRRDADREAAKAREAARLEALKIVKPLSEEWNAKVDKELAKSKGEITPAISRHSLATLLPKNANSTDGWLNDEIVNTFMEYVTLKAREDAGQTARGQEPHKYHAFSSQMYSSYKSKRGDVKQFARWTRKAKLAGTNLLQAEKLFIPVNDASHWTLLVINPMSRTISYYNSMSGKTAPFTTFALELLEMYLGNNFKKDEWSIVETASSRQTNGIDCGVFVCMNALAIVKGVEPTQAFDDTHIPNARRQVAAALINGGYSGDIVL